MVTVWRTAVLADPWTALLWSPVSLLVNLPLLTAFWVYLALLLGVNRLGRRTLSLSAFPEDLSLGLGEVGRLAFTAFAEDLFASLPRAVQRARGQCYLRGLMLEGRRKSVEPMAQRLGEVHYQALHFVAASPWDWRPVRRRLAEVLCAALQPTAWVVDDTGFPKDGSCSVGCSGSTQGRWARPPTASWGCRSTRSPNGPAARWTGGCLCLSPGTTTPQRCSSGGLPTTCPSVSTTSPSGSWCWADSGYGEIGEFRWGLDARQIPHVVEVRADTSACPEQVRPTGAPHKGRGRRPQPRYHHQPSSLTELAMAAGQRSCVDLIWRRGSKGLQRGRFLALRVRPAGVTPRRQARQHGGELLVRWLLAEWPRGKAEPTKYWLANLPGTTPLVDLVRLARLHWRVEQDYRELKARLGWIISRGVAGWAGTTTSRWSRSRMAF